MKDVDALASRIWALYETSRRLYSNQAKIYGNHEPIYSDLAAALDYVRCNRPDLYTDLGEAIASPKDSFYQNIDINLIGDIIIGLTALLSISPGELKPYIVGLIIVMICIKRSAV